MRACDSEMIRVGTSSRAAQKRVLQPPNQSPIRRIRCRFVFLQLKTVIPTPRKSMLMGDVVRATLLIFTSRFPVTKWDWWYPVSISLRTRCVGLSYCRNEVCKHFDEHSVEQYAGVSCLWLNQHHVKFRTWPIQIFGRVGNVVQWLEFDLLWWVSMLETHRKQHPDIRGKWLSHPWQLGAGWSGTANFAEM